MSARSRNPLHPDLFPRLAEFMAGYLHQDFELDHKTPEGALRAFAVAMKLSGLCMQQHRQRVLLRQALCHVGMTARGEMIAGADSDQSLCNGVAAFCLTALAAKPSQPLRRAQEAADDGPDQHGRTYDNQKRKRQYRQRCINAPVAP